MTQSECHKEALAHPSISLLGPLSSSIATHAHYIISEDNNITHTSSK